VTWVIILIIVGVIAIVVIAAVLSYNRFISQRTLIKNAWANVETELKRRYDLIPNLVETVKGYAAHEREVFEEVTRRVLPRSRPPRRVRSLRPLAACSPWPRTTRT
jgi:LemA protein